MAVSLSLANLYARALVEPVPALSLVSSKKKQMYSENRVQSYEKGNILHFLISGSAGD